MSAVADRAGRGEPRVAALAVLLCVLCAAIASTGCGLGAIIQAATLAGAERAPGSEVEVARRAAQDSDDPDIIGDWLLAELTAAGGNAPHARLARMRLEELGGGGLRAWLARAVDDDAHGRLVAALPSYLVVLDEARTRSEPDAPLYAWYAAARLSALRDASPDAWQRARTSVERAIEEPARIGWRARDVLVEWWARDELYRRSGLRGESLVERVVAQQGCLREASFAGPFARPARVEAARRFAAEQAGPWPARFPVDGDRGMAPVMRAATVGGCLLRAEGTVPAGIYYAQSFFDLDAPRELVVAVRGALTVLVDDVEVLRRDPFEWGSWVRVGANVALGPGRHRIVARLSSPETTIRVLSPDGRPAGVVGSADQTVAYSLAAPRPGVDPNALMSYVRAARTLGEGVPEAAAPDPGLRLVAAALALGEGAADLGAVILEPVAQTPDAAPAPVLALAAALAEGDPILAPQTARDLASDLRRRAVERDEGIWEPRLLLAIGQEERRPAADTLSDLESLAETFPGVPDIARRLAGTYARLGWRAELRAAVHSAIARFPEDLELLGVALDLAEQRGEHDEADVLLARIRSIDPSTEVELRRALARGDYDAAAAELRRLGSLAPERQDIAERVAEVFARAGRGDPREVERLERALETHPADAAVRLDLADARLARGQPGALREGLVDALRAGAESSELERALEVVDGATEFEPYRRDGLALVRDLEASGVELPGAAARVLDYAVLWVRPDGTARMLEHEVVRVQSQAGIEELGEQKLPAGLVLRARTIKRDGSIFEPEIVPGKATVTMPHLEVGDYVETETVWTVPSMGDAGRSFLAPRWFFREENISYHVSELVIVSPTSRPLEIETTGDVPAPEVSVDGALTVRRWQVTASIGLADEPFAVPAREFLPSVRAGWGIGLERHMRRLSEAAADEPPHDPRLVRAAKSHASASLAVTDGGEQGPRVEAAAAAPARSKDEQARELYRWVLKNVTPGPERNPQRIITGLAGDPALAFVHLCQLAGIDARLGLVQDGLAPPAEGPIAAAEAFATRAVRISTEQGIRWMLVGDPFAPYGFLPSSLRGQPAYALGGTSRRGPETPARELTNAAAGSDGVRYEGTAELAADGSGMLDLHASFAGADAIAMRHLLHREPPARHKDALEANLLGFSLAGAHIDDLSLEHLDDLDEPLVLLMRISVPTLARRTASGMELSVPLMPRLGALGALSERATPLYVSARIETFVALDLAVTLPEGATLASEPAHRDFGFERLAVHVADDLEGQTLALRRAVELPAARVQPSQYPEFRAVVVDAAAALDRPVAIVFRGTP